MPSPKKLPASKNQTPKAVCAVARQQLLLIDGLLDEVARNYVARLHREIAELVRALETRQNGEGFSRAESGDLQEILRQVTQLQIDPERGRRKDLKRIDALIGDVQATIDKW